MPLRSVEVTLKNGDTIMIVERLNNYVTKKLLVPEGIDTTKISTAVFIDEKSQINHVPTQICLIDDEYYAIKISSR